MKKVVKVKTSDVVHKAIEDNKPPSLVEMPPKRVSYTVFYWLLLFVCAIILLYYTYNFITFYVATNNPIQNANLDAKALAVDFSVEGANLASQLKVAV